MCRICHVCSIKFCSLCLNHFRPRRYCYRNQCRDSFSLFQTDFCSLWLCHYPRCGQHSLEPKNRPVANNLSVLDATIAWTWHARTWRGITRSLPALLTTPRPIIIKSREATKSLLPWPVCKRPVTSSSWPLQRAQGGGWHSWSFQEHPNRVTDNTVGMPFVKKTKSHIPYLNTTKKTRVATLDEC